LQPSRKLFAGFCAENFVFHRGTLFADSVSLEKFNKHAFMKISLNKTIITAGVCALAAIACADDQVPRMQSVPEANNLDTNNWDNQPITSQSFVWAAATTDMKEIHMGELALQKSDNDDVKSFAKRIIADHTKACKKLQAIAEKEGLDYPSTNSMAWDMNDRWHTNYDGWHTNSGNYENVATENPDKDYPPHLATLLVSNATYTADGRPMAGHEMNLESLSGAEFDRAFANHMVMGHERAISKFEAASASLQDASLKKYADKTLPILNKHLRLAQDLQSKVAVGPDSGVTNSVSQNSGYSNP
jgi:putative membrane protein